MVTFCTSNVSTQQWGHIVQFTVPPWWLAESTEQTLSWLPLITSSLQENTALHHLLQRFICGWLNQQNQVSHSHTSFCCFKDFRPVEAIHGSVQATIHPHLCKRQNKIFTLHPTTTFHTAESLFYTASITNQTYLSTLQPDVLQLIVNLPVPPNTGEEASETGSRDSSPSQGYRLQTDDSVILKNHEHTVFSLQKPSGVTSVPVDSVMRVFEPEVHYAVQLCANPLSTLLQLHHRHCSFKKKASISLL